MAKQSRRISGPTKKHLAREQRERRQMRFILAGSLIVLALVFGLVIYGVLDQVVIQKIRPVAVVNSENIRADDYEGFARYNRYLLIRNALQTYQFAQMFAGDPNTQAQFQSQLLQIQAQLDPNTGSVGKDSLDQLVDATLIRQQAEEMGITITEEEVDIAMQEAFGYFAGGTPTPTATFEVAPTSTLSPQQLTLIPPTATATITPTLTATATLSDTVTQVPPTETPAPTPTEEFTATPPPTPEDTPTPTPYTEEGFNKVYEETIAQFEEEYGITEKTIRFVIKNQVIQRRMQEAIVGDLPCSQEQVWALHILVEDEAQASDILDRLEAGEDWSVLAAKNSTDTSNKDRGGDLGWFGRGQMVPEFEEAAFSLQVGETSDPVGTSFGWHIIRVLGVEERPLTSDACQQMRQTKFQEWLDDVRAESDIEIKDYWMEYIPSEPTLPAELISELNQAAPQQSPALPLPTP
jgi:parvulin-like peptidyl-prolyl isomerase